MLHNKKSHPKAALVLTCRRKVLFVQLRKINFGLRHNFCSCPNQTILFCLKQPIHNLSCRSQSGSGRNELFLGLGAGLTWAALHAVYVSNSFVSSINKSGSQAFCSITSKPNKEMHFFLISFVIK